MQRVEVSFSTSRVVFDRNKPCLFTFSNNQTSNGSSFYETISALTSLCNDLDSISTIIGGDSINSVRVYDSEHNLVNTTDMTFTEYSSTITSGHGEFAG